MLHKEAFGKEHFASDPNFNAVFEKGFYCVVRWLLLHFTIVPTIIVILMRNMRRFPSVLNMVALARNDVVDAGCF